MVVGIGSKPPLTAGGTTHKLPFLLVVCLGEGGEEAGIHVSTE